MTYYRKPPAWHAEARRLRAKGWKVLAIAALFGVTQSAVSHVFLHHASR